MHMPVHAAIHKMLAKAQAFLIAFLTDLGRNYESAIYLDAEWHFKGKKVKDFCSHSGGQFFSDGPIAECLIIWQGPSVADLLLLGSTGSRDCMLTLQVIFEEQNRDTEEEKDVRPAIELLPYQNSFPKLLYCNPDDLHYKRESHCVQR